MANLNVITNPNFEAVFANYPEHVQPKMQTLRELVLETAQELNEISSLEETLKWGEPSFVTKIGSTLRMDWKPAKPNQYALYFQCSTRLVDTFRMVFDKKFNFEGSRAIILQLDEKLPVAELKECIKATLRYHEVKQDEVLGIWG